MGDGRYYTFFQFFNISILTLSIALLSMLLSFFFVKHKQQNKNHYNYFNNSLITISFFEILFLFFIFLDEVIFSINTSFFLNTLIIILFFLLNFFWIVLFIRSKSKPKRYFIYTLFILILSMILINCFTNSLFVVNNFNIISFSWTFYLIFSIFLLFSVIESVLYQLKYKNSYYLFYAGLLINGAVIIQMCSFYIWTLYIFSNEPKYFIYCSPIFILLFFIAGYKYMPQHFLPDSYKDFLSVIDDLILICNENNIIIYKNKTMYLSDLENIIEFSFRNIENLFRGYAIEILEESELYRNIRINNDSQEYFFYINYEKIKINNKLDGHLYRISDITQLYAMIKTLREKSEALKTINQNLIDYATRVKELHTEKNRLAILNDLQNILGHNMIEIIKLIESLELSISSKLYLPLLDLTIEKAKKSLDEIRKTVRNFKENFEVIEND